MEHTQELATALSSVWLFVIFATWTITSFLCHFFAKWFLYTFSEEENTTINPVLTTAFLTTVQLVFCAGLTELPLGDLAKGKTDIQNKQQNITGRILIIILHIFATLSTNGSMSMMYAASTFAIKLLEPVMSAVAQRLFLGIRLPCTAYISIPIVISGAIMFTGDPIRDWRMSVGSFLAFISNIFLSLRNVTIKANQMTKSHITLKSNQHVCIFLSCCLLGVLVTLYLVAVDLLQEIMVKQLCLVLLSSLFHVVYSYVSTAVVLKYVTVLDHSLGNIGKRLLVILFLYVSGSRFATLYNFIGLLICVLGMIMFVWSKDNHDNWDTSLRLVAYITLIGLIVFSCTSIVIFRRHNNQPSSKTIIPKSNYSGIWYDQKSENEQFWGSVNFNITEFLSFDPLLHQRQVNKLSRHLTNNYQVIEEANRIHINVFRSLIGRYKYAMLFNMASFENKGDPAIGVGEIILLRKLGIELLFYCTDRDSTGAICSNRTLEDAEKLSKSYSDEELVILLHGGGNIIGYPHHDHMRHNIINRFKTFEIIMFPQSIYLKNNSNHIGFCKEVYSSHNRLTFIYRDKTSLEIGLKLFPAVRSILLPDMAFQLGSVPRFMAPTFDILWLRRTDEESPKYTVPEYFDGYRVCISDWWWLDSWKTPNGQSPMEDFFLITTNGFMFLQRGRVVITDRLHGHILSTLLNIPHVLIDPTNHKIFNYHRDWTFGLNNVVTANSSTDAIDKAKKLLQKYDEDLPKVLGYFQ